MLTKQRKQLILKRLKRDGQIIAKTLGQELGLSEDTIRRDLRELAQQGLLQRVHGGALPASPALADFSGRQHIATNAKIAIGRFAAQSIQTGQIVFLDGGTTAVQLAKHLPPELEATIITHSPSVAVELMQHTNIEVVLVGGKLFKHSMVAVGASTIAAFTDVRADTYFMGVTGIHPIAGLTTGNSEEALVKRTMSKQAAETIVLASPEKLGVASAYLVAPISEASSMITTKDAPQELLAPYKKLGIAIVRV